MVEAGLQFQALKLQGRAAVLESMLENQVRLIAFPEIMERMEVNPDCNAYIRGRIMELRDFYLRPQAAAIPEAEVIDDLAAIVAEEKRKHEDVPGGHGAREGECRENEGEDHRGGLRDHEQAAPGDPVGDHPAVQGEQPHSQPRGEPRVAQPRRRARELEDEVPLRRGLHPGAEQRRHLAEEPEPVVGPRQRGERADAPRSAALAGGPAGRRRISAGRLDPVQATRTMPAL